jgi:hypothetical protein
MAASRIRASTKGKTMGQIPKEFYTVLGKDETLSVTPYRASAEKWAQKEGCKIHTFSEGQRGYADCVKIWGEYLVSLGFPGFAATEAPSLIQAQAPVGGTTQAPVQGQDLEAEAREEWARSPDLHREFGQLETYLAWRKAFANGQLSVTPPFIKRTNQDLEAQARRDWDASSELRQEFGRFGTYLGWYQAEKAGQVCL